MYIYAYQSLSSSTLTDCMIKLQKRAVRIILIKGIYTPSVEMFNQLCWMTFPETVNFRKAVMMYKIFNTLTPLHLPEYFKMTSDIHQRSLISTAENLYIPKTNTELFRTSHSYSGSKIWNTIPDHIKRSTCIGHFKRDYLKWTFHN